MNPIDLEMAARLAHIEDKHEGKIVYLSPCMQLDCGKLVHTRWWYMWAGFEHTERLNYWQIPK